MIVAAVDLGGTRCKAGAVEAGSGRLVDVLEPVPSGDTWAEAAAVVEAAVARVRAAHDVAGVALAMPGVLDGGRVVALPGKFPGAEGVDVAVALGGAVVVNDAVAAGVGEAVAGAGAGHDRVVVVTLGTGVGVCVVEGGRPLGAGPFGAGTLGGQVAIGGDASVPDAVRTWVDTAGRAGTVEARCRADALVAHGRVAGGAWDRGEQLVADAAGGDAVARAALDAYRADLVRALVTLAHAHAPSCLVVGGGPAAAGDLLFDGVQAAVASQLAFGLRATVQPAALGDAAALAGLGVLCAGGGTT